MCWLVNATTEVRYTILFAKQEVKVSNFVSGLLLRMVLGVMMPTGGVRENEDADRRRTYKETPH